MFKNLKPLPFKDFRSLSSDWQGKAASMNGCKQKSRPLKFSARTNDICDFVQQIFVYFRQILLGSSSYSKIAVILQTHGMHPLYHIHAQRESGGGKLGSNLSYLLSLKKFLEVFSLTQLLYYKLN